MKPLDQLEVTTLEATSTADQDRPFASRGCSALKRNLRVVVGTSLDGDTATVGFTATGSYDGYSNVVTARSIVVLLK